MASALLMRTGPNVKILKNYMELQPSTYSFAKNENFVNTYQKLLKTRYHFLRGALFYTKSKFYLKYFAYYKGYREKGRDKRSLNDLLKIL